MKKLSLYHDWHRYDFFPLQVHWCDPLRVGTQPLVPLRGGHLLHRHPLLDILLPAPDQGAHQGQALHQGQGIHQGQAVHQGPAIHQVKGIYEYQGQAVHEGQTVHQGQTVHKFQAVHQARKLIKVSSTSR
jgi:hypothetical protein